MQRSSFLSLLVVMVLGVWACATHFGGGRIHSDDLYTARHFLTGVQSEQKGYGLYSYLLFPAPPTSEEKGRYEAAIRAFLAYPPLPSMQALLPRETLNIFYLMLERPPTKSVTRCLLQNCYPVSDVDIDWILSHYNYARAQIILRRVSSDNLQNGPYIVTFTDSVAILPVLPNNPIDEKALFQDLSSVPPHLVRVWVEVFIENATGKGSSYKQNLRELLLHLETALENYAQGIPEVIEACKKYLGLRKLISIRYGQ